MGPKAASNLLEPAGAAPPDGATVAVTDGQAANVVVSLETLGQDLPGALEHLSVPSYLLDVAGVIRWVNPAAERIVGDVVGQQFTSVVPPEQKGRAREAFARKVIGSHTVTDGSFVVVNADGAHVGVDISSVPVHDGEHVVGVFGQVSGVREPPPEHPELHLTPRQADVLRLLEQGYSTTQIAEELQLSRETVRNHVRTLLRAVGARSRLEAVALVRASAA